MKSVREPLARTRRTHRARTHGNKYYAVGVVRSNAGSATPGPRPSSHITAKTKGFTCRNICARRQEMPSPSGAREGGGIPKPKTITTNTGLFWVPTPRLASSYGAPRGCTRETGRSSGIPGTKTCSRSAAVRRRVADGSPTKEQGSSVSICRETCSTSASPPWIRPATGYR